MDIGCIVDVETTGLDPQTDVIIEIGIIEFAVTGDAINHPRITSMYSACSDPNRPITSEIEKLTGLTNSCLKGQSIDWLKVRESFLKASIIIAHNAEFDRQFITRQPEVSDIKAHWGCSKKHIDWAGKGFRTQSLNYLACDHGFVNPFAHRALFDCATTFRLVSPHLSELIEKSYQRDIKLLANRAPFERREKLKKNRYFWDPQEKVWYKTILEGALNKERQFLKTEIYPEEDEHTEVFLN